MRYLGYCLILGGIILASFNAAAKEEYVFAKLIKKEELEYPRVPQIKGWEGWAYYSFSIGVDGLAHNIKILDSNGIPDFDQALINNIEARVYEPATYNGTPVEERREVGRATFVVSDKLRGASKSFLRSFKNIRKKLAQNELSEAFKLLDALRSTKIRSLYEELYLQTLFASYYDLAGDEEREYLHIERILDFYGSKNMGAAMVKPEFFVEYLAKHYQLQIASMKLGDAQVTAEWLDFIDPDGELTRKIKSHTETVKKKIAGREFGMRGKLVLPIYNRGSATWKAVLLGNEIQLTDVVGKIDLIHLYCNNGRKILSYTTGEGWIVPESWGRCTIYIWGEVDTTFVIHELPAGSLSRMEI